MWTYWQGGKRENGMMSADILLVGQDWGPCNSANSIIKKQDCAVAPATDFYVDAIMNDPRDKTDHNLLELFDSIGCSARRQNDRLFFTNLFFNSK